MRRNQLKSVVGWIGRNPPYAPRIIPPHLKLAILTRGRTVIPTADATWLIDVARLRGQTWPDRLRRPIEEIVPHSHVTVELFSNQRPAMSWLEIDETFHAYLLLRQRRHLPDCFVLYRFVPHTQREELEEALDLDIGPLFRKAGVRELVSEPERYQLLAYVCLPSETLREYLPPDRPPDPQPPAIAMPPLYAVMSPGTAMNVRKEAAGDIIGKQVGDVVRAWVHRKQEIAGSTWFEIEPWSDLRLIAPQGYDAKVAAGDRCWTVYAEKTTPSGFVPRLVGAPSSLKFGGGFLWVAAPWNLFRNDLRALEAAVGRASIIDRITALRQLSHTAATPFDDVIGTRTGAYLESIEYDNNRWQLLRDYQAVMAPDGRIIDLHHLLVGLDVLRTRERKTVKYLGYDIGSNWGSMTWGGDLGAGAADMNARVGTAWEDRHPWAKADTRAQFYFETRAGDHDLVADLDAWGIDALRRTNRQLDTVDALLASYYEHLVLEGCRTVTSARRDAVERFLAHYGFAYDAASDYVRYPSLDHQAGVSNVISEIERFAALWAYYRLAQEKGLLPSKHPVVPSELSRTLATLFLSWLETQAVENGATVQPDP